VTFAREKRLLLGWAALGVALPLPFTQALDVASLVAFAVAVALFLRRAAAGSERWLSNRALNLLGLAYLPLLVADVMAIGRVQPVRPILHLTLFGLAAKLWSLTRERDKWHAWIGVFFLFLASMATSTHPSIAAYLVAFVVLTVVLLARFVHLHVLSAFAGRRGEAPPLGLGRVVLAIVLATAALAAPLFALLPRVRSPFVVGPGVLGAGPVEARMGFSDELTLDLIGRLRANPEIALRVTFEGRTPPPAALRLKAAAYEAWEGRTWRPAPGNRTLRRLEPEEDFFRLRPGVEVGRARIALEPIRSPHLVVPVEAFGLDTPSIRLSVSDGGAVSLSGLPGKVFEYEALLAESPGSAAVAPGQGQPGPGPLALDGITPAIAALAAEFAGEGTAEERARRIERRFHADFAYSTDFVGRGGASPIETFLFTDRRGHCEYFASAMVLLLRAQGIPARLATGFYGAEWSPWDGSWVVRQSNAHAWVEAWLPERGWTVFEPTPPAGLPSAGERDLLASMRLAWDALVSRWDRWVISYDFDDQVGVIGGLRAWWSELFRRLANGGESPAGVAPPAGPTGAPVPPAPAGTGAARRGWRVAAFAAAVLLVAAFVWVLRHRRPWSAAIAYADLRRRLAAADLPVVDSTAPLALAGLVERRVPAAAAPAGRVIAAYVRSTFAGRAASAAELERLRGDLAAVELALRAELRRRRRAKTPSVALPT
jgi:transglutaminase-like putative cysteine protease